MSAAHQAQTDPEAHKKTLALNADTDAASKELAAAGIAYNALAKLDALARDRVMAWLELRLDWSRNRPPWGDVGTSHHDEEPPF